MLISQMTLLPSSTDLHYFFEVATQLHFSRAAKKLNVSQPSLSMAIKRLEIDLQTALFIRHKNGLTLTSTGQLLFDHVEKLFDTWQQTVSNIKNISEEVKGHITIGCHSTFAYFLTNLVSQLHTAHPGLEIHFHHDANARIMERIAQGTLDIGIVVAPYPHQDVIIHHVYDTEFAFWASNMQDVNKIDLYHEDTLFICDPQLAPTQFLINAILKKTKHKKLRLSTMNQIEVIAEMTTMGEGVGILPFVYTNKYHGHKLTLIPNAPICKMRLCIAYRPENKNIKSLTTVLNAIKNVAISEHHEISHQKN